MEKGEDFVSLSFFVRIIWEITYNLHFKIALQSLLKEFLL